MADRKTSDPKSKFEQVRIFTNPLSSNKTLDADGMIENILSKKQVFVKKSSLFPSWVTPGSGKIPPLYSEVWKAVQIPANPGYCNTPILSQILMSSGVTTQTLGYIWSLANKKCIGVLTEEELYLTMALIAISQNGTVIHNLDILKQVHEPIIPRLDLNIIKHFQSLQRYQQSHGTSVFPGSLGYKTQHATSAQSNFSISSISNSLPTSHHVYESLGTLTNSHAYSSAQSSSIQSEQMQDNAIQNISSMVELQTNAQQQGLFSQNKEEDNDDFSDFQSSATVKPTNPASNVSITLNPIHYLMSSPTPSNSKKPVQVFPAKSQTIATIDDDDFTDFQSALDFDVQIKQPNLMENIKTMIEPKQNQNTQKLIQRASDEHIASVLVDNVPQRTMEEVLDTMSDERKTTMYDTRDYSALKELQSEEPSLFELRDGETFPQSSTLGNHLRESTKNSRHKQCSNSLLFEDDVRPNGNDQSRRGDLTSTLSSLCQPSTLKESKIPSAIHDRNHPVLPTNIKSMSDIQGDSVDINHPIFPASIQSTDNDDFDDEFTDFKQADPIRPKDKENPDNINSMLGSSAKSSINYDYLRSLNDESTLDTNIFLSVFDTDLSVQTSALPPNSSKEEVISSIGDRILFSADNTNVVSKDKKEELFLNFPSNKSSEIDDDFDDFVQVATISKKSLPIQLKTNNKPGAAKTERGTNEEEDEFTDFEQAPKVINDSLTEVFSNLSIGRSPHATSNAFSVSDLYTSSQHDIQLLVNDANILNETHDALKTQKAKPKRDEEGDKYKALRGLDFLDENDDKYLSDGERTDKYLSDGEKTDKYLSDGDTLSLQEDKERDVSDGDNLSLQLPSVDSQDLDNIQTKCYDACIYILDTSLNLFLSNQIENEIVEHPKVIHHLKCLHEVYQVGKRLQTCGQIHTNNNKLDITWNALTAFFTDSILAEVNVNQIDQDAAVESCSSERCEICLSESNIRWVEENNMKYHAPCINLYLNCVEAIPPQTNRSTVH